MSRQGTFLVAGVGSRPLHEVTDSWARRHRPVLEPCVCAGPEIRAASGLDSDVLEAVLRHQVEPVHIAWDRAHGIPLSRAQRQAYALDGGA
jgi:hypothetical protein